MDSPFPPIQRSLIKRSHYLVPNSIVVSRGCPHHCDFCYKDDFPQGGKSFYTQRVDDALAEIERLPGRHLYFLDGRIITYNWDHYDTRHVVYRTRGLSAGQLKAGYDWAYEEFYRWPNILRGSCRHSILKHSLKHFFYTAGWKKFERVWNLAITTRQLEHMRPLLEAILSNVTASFMKQDEHSHDDADISPLQSPTPTLSIHTHPLVEAHLNDASVVCRATVITFFDPQTTDGSNMSQEIERRNPLCQYPLIPVDLSGRCVF